VLDSGIVALALVAGSVAAFNPCGFALLPAYLSMLMVDDPRAGGTVTKVSRTVAVRRAMRFTSGMTAGFVAVFGLFGVVVAPLALSVERYLPVVTLVIGALLVAVGGWLLAGRSLAVPGLAGWGNAPTRSWVSQVGYGVSFALASLSCTVGPFLAVTSGSLRGGSGIGVVATFLAYAIGMGTVVLVLAIAVVTASTSVTARLRRAAPVISRLSGILLLIAGTYVAWYGWFELRVLAGAASSDPVVSAAIEVQGALTRAVAGLGAPVLATAAGVVVVGTLLVLRSARRRDRGLDPERAVAQLVPE